MLPAFKATELAQIVAVERQMEAAQQQRALLASRARGGRDQAPSQIARRLSGLRQFITQSRPRAQCRPGAQAC